jgi:hypothetical protein
MWPRQRALAARSAATATLAGRQDANARRGHHHACEREKPSSSSQDRCPGEGARNPTWSNAHSDLNQPSQSGLQSALARRAAERGSPKHADGAGSPSRRSVDVAGKARLHLVAGRLERGTLGRCPGDTDPGWSGQPAATRSPAWRITPSPRLLAKPPPLRDASTCFAFQSPWLGTDARIADAGGAFHPGSGQKVPLHRGSARHQAI